MARNGNKTSPWVYVAIGCGVMVVLIGMAIVGGGFFLARKAKQFEAEMKDPEARAERVQEILDTRELPPGYYPVMGMSVPFLMDMAILSDVPPPEDGSPDDQEFDERGFFYFEILSSGKDRRELDRFMAGEIDDAEFLRKSSVNIRRGDVVARGTLDLDGVEARYVAQRGSMGYGGMGHRGDGLTTVLYVDCPGSRRLHMGMWFGPDPAPDAAPAELDLTGTVADEAELREFLSYFHFCGE